MQPSSRPCSTPEPSSSSEDDKDDKDEVLNRLTPEERDRFDYFRRACKLPDAPVHELMCSRLFPSVTVEPRAVTSVADASRNFAASLSEMARSLAPSGTPITPDLVMIAVEELCRLGRVPGASPRLHGHLSTPI
jgi:hypothetical protein